MANHTATKPETKTDMVPMEMFLELTTRFGELEKKVEELQARPQGAARNNAQREMTDDDARRIMNGDLKDMKHNDAAAKLGLSYGQVYSCRLGYTFKHIHKELNEVKDYKNAWIK
jgi:hypothetical protein